MYRNINKCIKSYKINTVYHEMNIYWQLNNNDIYFQVFTNTFQITTIIEQFRIRISTPLENVTLHHMLGKPLTSTVL